MCGIIGIFSLDGAPLTGLEAPVRAGMQRMTLRGPDDQGFYASPLAVLGHRRLAVIDLQTGNQPLTDPKTGATIVYNGEIYNFREVRTELEARGRVFRTQSDTEVLLNAFLEWGAGCLDRLAGMFAFALHLPAERRIFLARDRVGIKPLFYARAAGRLMFASTIPALRCLPGVSSEMDIAAASHYLTTVRTTFGERTLFRDISALLPGRHISATVGQEPVVRQYWSFPVVKPADKPDPGLDKAAEVVRGLLVESLKGHLISDVPLGGLLSGGLDSSIIAGLAHDLAHGRYDAYAAGYDVDGFNEWEYVRQAAAFHKIKCTEVHLGLEGFTDTWRYLVAHHGLPLSTWNQAPIYHLAQALRQDFTVALSGEGADEIFGGYVKSYFSAYDYERARREPHAPGERPTAFDRALMRVYRRPYIICRPDHFFLQHSWIPLRQKRKLLNEAVWQETLAQDAELFQFYENLLDEFRDCTTMDAYMHIHARVNLEGLLFRMDACTMAASVEARVPYTDHRLIEYAFSLPDSYKIRWKHPDAEAQAKDLAVDEIDSRGLLESKALLRRAFTDIVPREILARPKMSFPVPVCDWLAGPLLTPARDIILSSSLPGTLLAKDMLEYYLKTPAYRESAMALWPIVNLCLWQVQSGASMT